MILADKSEDGVRSLTSVFIHIARLNFAGFPASEAPEK
jgi:hypothetical protein